MSDESPDVASTNPYEAPRDASKSAIRRTSGLATASLILSCSSLLIGCFGFLPGIICGHMARSECQRQPSLGGAGLALAGLIIGYWFAGMYVLVVVVLLLTSASSGPAVHVYTLN